MSTRVEDPSKLTISQLKTQLKKLGVQAPKDARKAEYVLLYESSVKASRTQRAGRATPRRAPPKKAQRLSEFSSDEEAEPASPRAKQMPRRGKSNPKDEKFNRNLDVVQGLTDKELREELSYYNISAAITSSTRGAYEKKLATFMTNPPAPSRRQAVKEEEEEEEEDEEEEEEEEEEDEYSDSEPEEIQTPKISGRGDARGRQTPATTRRRAAAERVNQEQQTSPKTEAVIEEEGGVSLKVQLFILLLVASLLFLIWYFTKDRQSDGSSPGVTQV